MSHVNRISQRVAGRKTGGRPPIAQTFERIGAVQGQVALIVEGEEADWRTHMYAALRDEAGNEHQYPQDWKEKHRYRVGQTIIFALAGTAHIGRITAAFEAGCRLRYQIAIGLHKIAMTQAQLLALTQTRMAIHYVPRTESRGAGQPPNTIGSKLANAAVPPLKWFGQSAKLKQRMLWAVE